MTGRDRIVLAAVLLAACATVPLIGRKQLSVVPASEMLALGAESYAGILGEARLSTDPERIELVQLGGVALSAAMEEKPRETRQLLELAYGIGANVGLMLPYSRSHELEADHIGLILMARAGYDPREAPGFWHRMGEAGGARPAAFLSTHPASDRRVQELEALLPEAMEEYRP